MRACHIDTPSFEIISDYSLSGVLLDNSDLDRLLANLHDE